MAALAAVQSVTKPESFSISIGELAGCSDANTGINGNIRACAGFSLHILDHIKHQMLKFIAVQHLVDSRI